MRRRIGWFAAALVVTAGATPFARAADDTTIEALKARNRDLERRVSQLEDKQVRQQDETRKQILDVLKDMNIEAERHDNDFRVYWSNGIRMKSGDGNVSLKIGGRLMYDFGWVDGSGIEEDLGVDLEDGVDMRRARLYVSGKLYKSLAFKWQYDFAGGSAAAKDVYLRFLNLPIVQNVTVGHFKEPFSLEELTSSKYITFMERSLANAFSPGRNAGVMAHGALLDERMTYAIGMFKDVSDGDDSETNADGGGAVTARVTGLPWYQDDGAKLLHLGAGWSCRNAFARPEDEARFRNRPEAHFISDRFTDTGAIDVDGVQLYNAEMAMVYGPFSLQGEYFAADPQANDGSELCLQGFYVEGSYFITGERRPYDTGDGTFGRVKPKNYYGVDGGLGAWQVATRYSYVDLGDSDLPSTARRVQDVTLGLNWYLNPNMRLMWNYIRSCVDGRDVSNAADIFMMRVQVDF